MRVLFLGEADDGISVSSHHARALRECGAETRFETPSQDGNAKRADVIHLVAYEQTDSQLLRRLAKSRLVGTSMVRFWTGRDVLWAERHEPSRAFAMALTRMGVTQVARSPDMVARLERIGVAAAVGPVVSPNIHSTHEPEPMPAVFTVLCRLPTSRRESSGGAIVDRLIERLGNVRFLILGDAETSYAARKNVESLGQVEDASRAILRSTVLIVPRVDGSLSRLALEMLCHGRHVISRHPLPHSAQAGDVESYFKAIRLLERDLSFNLAGREYVCEHYSTTRTTRELHALLESCIDPGDVDRRGGGRWMGAMGALSQAGLVKDKHYALPDPRELPPDDPFRALLADAHRSRLRQPVEAAIS